MPVQNSAEASKLIRKWMEDRKVFKSDSSDANKDTVQFSYDGTCNNGVNFTIQQPKDMVRVVGITTKMLFAPIHLKKISSFDQHRRDKFFRDLTKSLLLIPPSFFFGPNPEKPEWTFIIKEISYDELTEGRLIEAVEQVSRAVLWASAILVDEFGEPNTE